jgi:hypothetical protein
MGVRAHDEPGRRAGQEIGPVHFEEGQVAVADLLADDIVIRRVSLWYAAEGRMPVLPGSASRHRRPSGGRGTGVRSAAMAAAVRSVGKAFSRIVRNSWRRLRKSCFGSMLLCKRNVKK